MFSCIHASSEGVFVGMAFFFFSLWTPFFLFMLGKKGGRWVVRDGDGSRVGG
jgi:hypothetical protein